jgi:hypothetical protein
MHRSRRFAAVVTLASALALPVGGADPPPAAAPTPDPHAHGHQHPPPGDRHARQLAARAELRRNLEAMDARIDRLADAVEAATGEAKLAARDSLLRELMAQRQRLREMLLRGEIVDATEDRPPAARSAPAAAPNACGCGAAAGGASCCCAGRPASPPADPSPAPGGGR